MLPLLPRQLEKCLVMQQWQHGKAMSERLSLHLDFLQRKMLKTVKSGKCGEIHSGAKEVLK